MNQETFQKNYTMQSVHKAIHVLRAFSKEQPRLSLTQLHKKTGIGISGLQRFVSTLVYEGFLHKDEKTKEYQLGLSLLYLGHLVEQESSLLTISKPILKKINDVTGESVCINIIDGDERRCIFNLDSTHPLSTKTFVGHTSPLYAGASAKSLLACLSEQELNDYLNRVQLNPITNKTISDVTTLKEELAIIRQQGYALSRSERVLGAYSISAAIMLLSNRPLASISIVIPEVRVEQFLEQQLIDMILRAKMQIEQQL